VYEQRRVCWRKENETELVIKQESTSASGEEELRDCKCCILKNVRIVSITVFFGLLNDSENNWSYMCKTLTKVCTAAVHVDQTLVCFSLFEHSFQNSTHLSQYVSHNLHNTVDLEHFVQMLTHCCKNCEPHIQNRIDLSLVPFTHCSLEFQLKGSIICLNYSMYF